jgi:hypothetical protein
MRPGMVVLGVIIQGQRLCGKSRAPVTDITAAEATGQSGTVQQPGARRSSRARGCTWASFKNMRTTHGPLQDGVQAIRSSFWDSNKHAPTVYGMPSPLQRHCWQSPPAAKANSSSAHSGPSATASLRRWFHSW